MVPTVNFTACLPTGPTASRSHAEEQAWGQLHGKRKKKLLDTNANSLCGIAFAISEDLLSMQTHVRNYTRIYRTEMFRKCELRR